MDATSIRSYIAYRGDQLIEPVFGQLALDRGLTFVVERYWKTNARELDGLSSQGRVIASRVTEHIESILIDSGDQLMMITLDTQDADVTITIATHGDTAAAGASIERVRAALPTETDTDQLPITFWYDDTMGGDSSRRVIDAVEWQSIASNYPSRTHARVEELCARFRPERGGRLILWHGEPGTGKTHALRALAREWREWCSAEYVTDPERFFADVRYMMNVVLSTNEQEWRLLMLEDTGELLAADAKDREGQKLSRFLNLVDGILGQGLRTVVLVTTNEDVRALHPAVSRPGRCAASVAFERFSAEEAETWLRARGSDARAQSATLAELYALAERGEETGRARRPLGFSL